LRRHIAIGDYQRIIVCTLLDGMDIDLKGIKEPLSR